MTTANTNSDPIQEEILRFMAKTSVNAIVGTCLVVGLVIWIVSGKVESSWLYAWCGFMAIVNSARLLWSMNFLSQEVVDVRFQTIWVNCIIVAHAVSWATMGYLLTPLDFTSQAYLSVIVVGVVAIAIQTVMFDRVLIVVMVGSVIGGIAYCLFESGMEDQATLAYFLVIYGAVAMLTSFRLRETLWDLVTAKHQNQKLVSSLSDVTVKLENSIEELQQEYLANSAFVAEFHHELRTPINAISGFTQLLELNPLIAADEGAGAKIRHIKNAIGHVEGLVDRVLDLASIEAGEVQLSSSCVDVGELGESAIEMLAASANERDIKIAFQASEEPCLAYADSLRVTQVMLNLISNAIKYNRLGGQITITVELGKHGNVIVAVIDTGVGLKAVDRETAFRAFGRLRPQSGVSGTGLGLHLSSKIIERMGGTLDFDSVPGSGSRFYFTLPGWSHHSALDGEISLDALGQSPDVVPKVKGN